MAPKTSPVKRSSRKEEKLLVLPGASVYLTQDAKVVELARGDLSILRIVEDEATLATDVTVGSDLRWPLTKDEPVVKLDQLHYLFSLPDKDGGFLNYGVSFAAADVRLASLDMFLKENACLSTSSSSSDASAPSKKMASSEIYWKDYASKVEDHNGVLGKAITQGTGEIVNGLFRLNSGYAGQVQKGANLFEPQAQASKTGPYQTKAVIEGNQEHREINKTIRSARELLEMTDKTSKYLLNGVILVTGSPLVQSKAGSSLLSTPRGEANSVNQILDAVEAAGRKTIAATSGAVAGAVSKRFGESAGEATEDVLATAIHLIGTAWNLFRIKEAIAPSSSLKSLVSKNTPSSSLKSLVSKNTPSSSLKSSVSKNTPPSSLKSSVSKNTPPSSPKSSVSKNTPSSSPKSSVSKNTPSSSLKSSVSKNTPSSSPKSSVSKNTPSSSPKSSVSKNTPSSSLKSSVSKNTPSSSPKSSVYKNTPSSSPKSSVSKNAVRKKK